MFYSDLDGVPIADIVKVFDYANDFPSSEKLNAICSALDVEYREGSRRFLATSRVFLVGVGGIPIALKDEGTPPSFHGLNGSFDSRANLSSALKLMSGAANYLTYMNPRSKSLHHLAEAGEALGHLSSKHTIYFNLLIVGCSAAVELELATQRDKIHLARMTHARAAAQDRPLLNVGGILNTDHLVEVMAQVDELTDAMRLKPELNGGRERINSLFPSLKATCILVSGTKRSIDSLKAQTSDSGKEIEYRDVVSRMCDITANL